MSKMIRTYFPFLFPVLCIAMPVLTAQANIWPGAVEKAICVNNKLGKLIAIRASANPAALEAKVMNYNATASRWDYVKTISGIVPKGVKPTLYLIGGQTFGRIDSLVSEASADDSERGRGTLAGEEAFPYECYQSTDVNSQVVDGSELIPLFEKGLPTSRGGNPLGCVINLFPTPDGQGKIVQIVHYSSTFDIGYTTYRVNTEIRPQDVFLRYEIKLAVGAGVRTYFLSVGSPHQSRHGPTVLQVESPSRPGGILQVNINQSRVPLECGVRPSAAIPRPTGYLMECSLPGGMIHRLTLDRTRIDAWSAGPGSRLLQGIPVTKSRVDFDADPDSGIGRLQSIFADFSDRADMPGVDPRYCEKQGRERCFPPFYHNGITARFELRNGTQNRPGWADLVQTDASDLSREIAYDRCTYLVHGKLTY